MASSDRFDTISLLSIRNEWQASSWQSLGGDLLAGINVALLTIPQAMAYALIAGLPIACSIYASIFAAFTAALFGSSRHLIVGQSYAIAILLQAGTAEILFNNFRYLDNSLKEQAAVQILIQITFLAGLFQMLIAGFRLGRLTQFVSQSVITGYIIGAALVVIINQLYTFLGVELADGTVSVWDRVLYLIANIHQFHMPTALLGVASVLLLLFFKYLNQRLPAAVLMLGSAALIVQGLKFMHYNSLLGDLALYIGDSSRKMMTVGDIGDFSGGWPDLYFPFIDAAAINASLPIAFAVALLSILETVSVAKNCSAASGQRFSVNQEIFGVGLGNIVSAVVGGVPVAGTASRSMLNYDSGAKTRFAAMSCALWVAVIISLFGFFIAGIPLAALAAFLLYNSVMIVNKRQLMLCLKATRGDAFVLVMTLLACIFFSFDVAFYIGVVLSITLYLRKAALPQLVEYEVDDAGGIHKLNAARAVEHKTIRLIKIEGELFFGAADLFQTTLKAFAEDDTETKVIILQLKNARDIDATTCLALQRLNDFMQSSGRLLVLCGVTAQVSEVLKDSDLIDELGKDNIVTFDDSHPHAHTHRALAIAKRFAIGVEPGKEHSMGENTRSPSVAKSFRTSEEIT